MKSTEAVQQAITSFVKGRIAMGASNNFKGVDNILITAETGTVYHVMIKNGLPVGVRTYSINAGVMP